MKFRVWCKDHEEWEKDLCLLSQEGRVYQSLRSGIRSFLPESHVVEFSTGLLDKNSLPIFDGDIVKGFYQDFGRGKQITKTKYAGVIHSDHSYWAIGQYKLFVMEDASLKVIGNIHENPELLEPIKK